jgi:3-oxoacyl-[acyl-carrier protein] reductase
MELGLKNRVALVTGASKGIGRATALELATEGCDAVICARGLEELNQVRDAVMEKGVRCLAVKADITEPDSINAMIAEIERTFGRLDILVNNAGGARPGTFANLSDQVMLEDYQVKILGQVRCTRAALGLLEKSPAPRVVNVNAIAGRVVNPNLFATTTHRAACYALSKALAIELAPKGILVNSVNVGMVVSWQWDVRRKQVAPEMSLEEFTAARAEGVIPLGRFGKPEEVSGLIAFLASDRASYISGASIDVGGGYGSHV